MFPRRGAIALVTTAIALVLLFNFKTPDQPSGSTGIASTGGSLSTTGSGGSTSSSTGNASSNGSASSGGSGSAGSSSTPSATSGATTGSETLTGEVVASRYGSTQVQVTISNGQITSVTALQLPTGGSLSTTRSSTSSTGSTSSSSSGATPAPASSTTTGVETLTGSIYASPYGNTQVQVTISNGQITSVTALQLPTGGRSGQISNYVEPILSSEALTAQSANIDIVSGATYTSEAYAQSLQSALDRAAVSIKPAG